MQIENADLILNNGKDGWWMMMKRPRLEAMSQARDEVPGLGVSLADATLYASLAGCEEMRPPIGMLCHVWLNFVQPQ